jgi:hypothetical protein
MLPEEIKHRSLQTTIETVPCPNEAEEKDMLESDRLKAVVTWTNTKSRQEHGEAQRSNRENSI